MVEFLFCLVCLMLGIVVGNGATALRLRSKMSGSIVIDNSEPDGEPLLYLELTESTDELMNKKSAEFSIKTKNFISHK